MTLHWIQMFLDVPQRAWTESVPFWADVTQTRASQLRGENNHFTMLVPPEGASWVKLQAVGDEQPRVHLDLDDTDRPTALAFSQERGAQPQWVYEGVPVMRSPGGLTFCHTLAETQDGATERPALARHSARQILDQVCLDIPPRLWEQEVAFWADVTGREIREDTMPQFLRLLDARDPEGSPRILLQRLETDAPVVSAHPDFAVADRAAETRRHLALGAEHIEALEWWTVLRAPSGHLYCLIDRDPLTGR